MLPSSRRALQLLDGAIASLEEMASSKEPLDPRKLGRLFGDLHSLQQSMRKLEITGVKSRDKFWKLQRRAVVVIIKIAKHLSTS
jgi:hypothetical protein